MEKALFPFEGKFTFKAAHFLCVEEDLIYFGGLAMSDAIAAAVTYISMWELICMGKAPISAKPNTSCAQPIWKLIDILCSGLSTVPNQKMALPLVGRELGHLDIDTRLKQC